MTTSLLRQPVKQFVYGALERSSRRRILWRGPTNVRRVALTFDDGPDHRTDEYLAILSRFRVPATFFVMGQYVENDPSVLGRYLRGGHQVAGHGYVHERFTTLSPRR
jgi:peptidoglycan-N-acetylglucosamine deacetylase